MNEITAPRFKFGQAAYGAGITAKTLRNWLQRGQIELFNARGEDDAHFAFSLADLVILAVVAELVRYGMPVRDAFDGIDRIRREIGLLATFKNTPLRALYPALMNKRIWATSGIAGWGLMIEEDGETPNRDEAEEKLTSILIINVAACYGEVLRRVREFEETSSAFSRQFGEKEAANAEKLMAEGRPEGLEYGETVPFSYRPDKEKPE